MRIIFLLLSLSLLCLECTFGQVKISGKVKNAETGTSLEGVVITVLKIDTTTIISYALSNEQGEFSIQIPSGNQTFLVKASLLGFASRIFALAQQIPNNLIFQLNTQATQLKEVTVKPPKISQRKDTISYNVSLFSNGQDKTIGDVLKKLPGIDVQDDGTILYNGKAINKFYIEGLDLLDSKYGIAVNNISPKDIQSVELLEGHQPIKALKSTTPTDRAALNLTLKNSSKARWLGHTELAAGLIPVLWKADALALKISGKDQSLNLFQTNNIGENITNQLKPHTLEDYLNGQDNQFEQTNIINVKPEVAPVDDARSLFNKTFLASTNNLHLLKNDYQLKTNIIYVNDQLSYTNNSVTNYYNYEKIQERITENNAALSKQNRGNVEITLNKNTNKFYLNNKLTGQLFWDNTTVSTSGSSPTIQKNVEPYHFAEDDFNFIKVYGKNILKINSFNQLNFQPESLNFTTTSPTDPVIQVADHRDFSSHTNVSLGITYSKWTLEYRMGLNATIQKLNSSIEANGNVLPVSDSLKNDLYWRSLNYFGRASAQFINDKLNFKLELPVNLYQTSLKSLLNQSSQLNNYVFLNPDVTFNYKFSPFWSMNIHGELTARTLGIEYFNEGYIYHNYRNIFLGGNEASIERRQNYSATLNYRSPIKALFVSFSGLYSPTVNNQLTQRSFVNYLTIERLVPLINEKSLWTITGRISKGLDAIQAVASLFVTYHDNTGSLLQSGQLLKSENRSLQINPKYNMSLIKKFNVEYNGNFMTNKLVLSGRDRAGSLSNVNQKISVGLIFNKKLNVKTTLDYIDNQLTPDQYLSAFFADFSLQYLPVKNIEVNMDFRNIFNKRTIAYNIIETASYTSSVYTIRPFNALIGIKFNW